MVEIKSNSLVREKSASSFGSLFSGGNCSSYGPSVNSSLAYELCQKSAVIGDVVDRIGSAHAAITPVLIEKGTNKIISDPKDHPLLELLDNPGMRQKYRRFAYESMKSFLLTGEVYPVISGNVNYEPLDLVVRPANKVQLNGMSDELHSILMTSAGKQTQYSQRLNIKKRSLTFQAGNELSETIQIMKEQRAEGLGGLSPLEQIYYEVITSIYGNKHNSNLLKNSTRPGGLWSPKEPMTQDGYKLFRDEIRDKFQGPGNAGKNIVAPQPVEYVNFLLKTQEMDFINMLDRFETSIYSRYQIPLPLVKAGTMTMGNFSQAAESFYDYAVIPRTSFIFSELGQFLLLRYKGGDRYILGVDERSIPALKERLYKRAKLMSETYIFSDNEMRAETGREALGPEGDVVNKPATLIPSVEDDDYTEDNIDRE